MKQWLLYSMCLLHILQTATKTEPLFSPDFLQSALTKPPQTITIQLQTKPIALPPTCAYTQEEIESAIHKLLFCYVLYKLAKHHYAFVYTHTTFGIIHCLYSIMPSCIQHAHYYIHMIIQTIILTGFAYCYKIIAHWLLWYAYGSAKNNLITQNSRFLNPHKSLALAKKLFRLKHHVL